MRMRELWDRGLFEQSKRSLRRTQGYGVFFRKCETFVELSEEGRCKSCGLELGQEEREGKSKTAAILTSIFFGIFGWLYTFKEDAWKILLNIGIIALIDWRWLIFAWVWAIGEAFIRPDSYYSEYNYGRDISPLKSIVNVMTAIFLVVTGVLLFFMFI